ncbi:hypothetical protein AWV79_08130 [Cupriavidus sp. UYMMa02A]|nr:hypothetical protein AWV79_08130 [Cupriavidus sp. UYMMa02A]
MFRVDARSRDGCPERRHHPAGTVAHRRRDGRDARLEETFLQHIAAFAVTLDHVIEFFDRARRAFRKHLQPRLRIELAQFVERQIFEQHPPEHRGMRRQARANVDRARKRRGATDLAT